MKNRHITLVAAAMFGLVLLPSPLNAQDEQNQVRHYALLHAGIARHYSLFVPSGYTPGTALPLVVNIHGGGLNDMLQNMMSGMNVVAERENFLVAYPDAVDGYWYGHWKTDPWDDVGYLGSVINQVSTLYSIDASRVYATGFSEGAITTYILNVAFPDTFAAIAPVAAFRPYTPGTDILFPPGLPWVPSRPTPVLQIQGTADLLVPYEGGLSYYGWEYPACEEFVGAYALNNGWNGSPPTVLDLPDLDPTDGTTVQLLTYNCGTYVDTEGNQRSTETLLYRVVGGGHNWPSDYNWVRTQEVPATHDIVASEVIWAFFSRHALAAP